MATPSFQLCKPKKFRVIIDSFPPLNTYIQCHQIVFIFKIQQVLTISHHLPYYQCHHHLSPQLLPQPHNQSSIAHSPSILNPASRVIILKNNNSDHVTFLKYFQWVPILLRLKTKLIPAWNNLFYPLASMIFFYALLLLSSMSPGPLTIPQNNRHRNTAASLHLLFLLSGMLFPQVST